MPSYPPRNEPIKKVEELSKREKELQHAIKNNFSREKLTKAVEKYRTAQLSLLKAKTHLIHDNEFQQRPHNLKIESIEKKIEIWRNKTFGDIINEFKTNYNN